MLERQYAIAAAVFLSTNLLGNLMSLLAPGMGSWAARAEQARLRDAISRSAANPDAPGGQEYVDHAKAQVERTTTDATRAWDRGGLFLRFLGAALSLASTVAFR